MGGKPFRGPLPTSFVHNHLWKPAVVVENDSTGSMVYMSWNGAIEYDSWAIYSVPSPSSTNLTLLGMQDAMALRHNGRFIIAMDYRSKSLLAGVMVFWPGLRPSRLDCVNMVEVLLFLHRIPYTPAQYCPFKLSLYIITNRIIPSTKYTVIN